MSFFRSQLGFISRAQALRELTAHQGLLATYWDNRSLIQDEIARAQFLEKLTKLIAEVNTLIAKISQSSLLPVPSSRYMRLENDMKDAKKSYQYLSSQSEGSFLSITQSMRNLARESPPLTDSSGDTRIIANVARHNVQAGAYGHVSQAATGTHAPNDGRSHPIIQPSAIPPNHPVYNGHHRISSLSNPELISRAPINLQAQQAGPSNLIPPRLHHTPSFQNPTDYNYMTGINYNYGDNAPNLPRQSLEEYSETSHNSSGSSAAGLLTQRRTF